MKKIKITSLEIAFVQGAKWWEFKSTRGTMWQSDQRVTEAEALIRIQNGTLGKLPKHIKDDEEKACESGA